MMSGFELDMQSIRFHSYRSGTGPTNWTLKSSTDGYTADLASGPLTPATSWQTNSAALASNPDNGTVTFRLYGSGASSGAGTWRLDNVSFTGEVDTVAGAFIATDSDLNTNGLGIAASVQDVDSGIFGIADPDHKPTFDLLAPGGFASTDLTFGSGPANGEAQGTAATLASTNGFSTNYANIVLGSWTAVVSAVDYDDDRTNDSLSVSVTNTFSVVDDDAVEPKFSVSRGTYLTFDGQSAGSDANAVTDGSLTNGLTLSNRVYDARSGMLEAGTQFRVQSPDGWNSDLQDFTIRPGNGGAKTNQWVDAALTTVFEADFDVDLNVGDGRALGIWTSTFYAVDYDDDRPNDALSTTQAFQMFVIDDDKLGPRMTNVQSTGSAQALIATGFESVDGWSGHDGTNWTHDAYDGTWTSTSAYVLSLNARGTDQTDTGFKAGFNAVNDALQLPSVDRPGWLTVWARNSGSSGTAVWVLEEYSGSWNTIGSAASVSGTDYSEHAWLIDSTNTGVQLRLRMTTLDGSIYFDDLVVTPYRDWTNQAVNVTWGTSTDEPTGDSGIGDYRVMPLRTQAPLYSTNGTSLGLVTNTSFAPSQDNQGIVTGYVFAVDNDTDRGARDRAMGLAIPTIARLDILQPTSVPLVNDDPVSTDNVDDPTSQFDVIWNPASVGPDDPNDTGAYPTWATPGNRNLLSPWQTYKIYYGPYDSTQVPLGDQGRGNGDAFIFTNFIANGDYKTLPGWKCVVATNRISDPSAPNATAYTNLANQGTNQFRLYDLEFDQEYVVVIAGVDKAGNEGPATVDSWATNDTIKFSLIRGVIMNKQAVPLSFTNGLDNTNTETAAAMYWLAAGTTSNQIDYSNVKKDYDLLYWDAGRFQESTNNAWQRIATVRSNWFVDDGGQFNGRGQMRFYRASYKDRWQTTRIDGTNVLSQRPLVSEEVYAIHNVVLSAGQNFVALHGVPYTNTFEGVFGGLEAFPGGGSTMPDTGSTVVEFYSSIQTDTVSTNQFWLSADGIWRRVGGTSNLTTVLQPSNFFNRGFSITLPNPVPTNYAVTTAWDNTQLDTNGLPVQVPAMVWSPIAQVPTNNFSQEIFTGSRSSRVSTLIYNVAALRLPVSAHPSELQLTESGFVSGPKGSSDEIYTMNTATKGVLSGSTIYCDAQGTWRFVGNNGLVPGGYFKPNDVIVIVSRNYVGSGSWTWSYGPGHFYTLPTRWRGY